MKHWEKEDGKIEKEKIPILSNHDKDKIIGIIELQKKYPKDYNQEMHLEPAFIMDKDGSLELLEVSLCFNQKSTYNKENDE